MSDPTHQKPDLVPGGLSSHKIPFAPGSPGSTDGPGSSSGAADGQPDPPVHSLCEADGQALDALLAARASGADRGPTPPGLGERTDKVTELLSLLEQDTVPDPSADLTARTLQAIRASEQRKRFTEQVQMLSEPRRTLGVGWHQLMTAAAVFIIGACLLIPVMDRQQADSRRVAGAGNMRYTGQALANYAVSNLGQMPRGDIRPGAVWWDVGEPQSINGSNSAHLYRLVSKGYAEIEYLTCPENEYAQRRALSSEHRDWTGPRAVSFSYQNQYSPKMLRLEDAPSMAVLADRNPLYEVPSDHIVFNPETPFNAPSRAHRGMGQNVLTADGVVSWSIRPVLELQDASGSDNIWTASGIDFYTGTEVPADPFDSMLIP